MIYYLLFLQMKKVELEKEIKRLGELCTKRFYKIKNLQRQIDSLQTKNENLGKTLIETQLKKSHLEGGQEVYRETNDKLFKVLFVASGQRDVINGDNLDYSEFDFEDTQD